MMELQSSVAIPSTSCYHPSRYHDPIASLAYRPLQLPLQQPTHLHHQPQQHHPSHHQHHLHQGQYPPSPVTPDHHQQQTPFALAYQQQSHQQHHQLQHPHRLQQSSDFRQHLPSYSHQQHQLQPTSSAHHHRTRAQARQQHRTMAYNAPTLSEEELAEMQKASADYQPEVTGPLVGERQPSSAITTEYASADPIYQAKTAALPQKYSHYRTVRGDGACGWRAVAFGYFEALIHFGDVNKIAMEQARLTSMSNIMAQAGEDRMMFEDFVDETLELLRDIASALSDGRDASAILMDRFNDSNLQMYIITHLRLLTSSWMKTHEDEYAPYLIGNTISQYCSQQVMPAYAEVDNISLAALKDALLSGAGMSLEVMYLDRSEGSEVNMHRWTPTDGSYPIGSVRLLYRPGHYDLLYKEEDIPAPPPQPQQVATYLQYASQPHQEPVYDLGVSDFLTMIPGLSYANSAAWALPTTYGGDPVAPDFFTNAPPQTCGGQGQSVSTPSAPTPQPQEVQANYVAISAPTQSVPPPSQLTHDLPIRNGSHTTLLHSDFQHQLGAKMFRPSIWQLEPDFGHTAAHVQYQTAIFRNSHFNTAHFLNPDFQPEQWDPEDEYATATSSGKSSSRRKSSG